MNTSSAFLVDVSPKPKASIKTDASKNHQEPSDFKDHMSKLEKTHQVDKNSQQAPTKDVAAQSSQTLDQGQGSIANSVTDEVPVMTNALESENPLSTAVLMATEGKSMGAASENGSDLPDVGADLHVSPISDLLTKTTDESLSLMVHQLDTNKPLTVQPASLSKDQAMPLNLFAMSTLGNPQNMPISAVNTTSSATLMSQLVNMQANLPLSLLVNPQEKSASNLLNATSSAVDTTLFNTTLSDNLEGVINQSLATVATQKPTVGEANSIPQLTMNTSFTQAKWGEAVTEKVMWMSAKGIKEARIQLDPPELGQLIIKVTVSQDQAQVNFTAQHATVREALDQQSLRLKEMFEEEGMNLVDVDVSDQSQGDEMQSDEDPSNLMQESDNIDTDSELIAETVIHSQNNRYSLVDSYV